jgi:Mnd1 HTH domain/Leucine zipper with capping helix domain
MSKKGKSFEEKREVMLSIFHQESSVYNMKELEYLGGQNGVVEKTVCDVIESLLNDKLIECEQVGSTKLYWSFPSKSIISLQKSIQNLEETVKKDTEVVESLQSKLRELVETPIEAKERTVLLGKVNTLRAKKQELEKELSKFKQNDVQLYNELVLKAKMAKEGADLYTDNVFKMIEHIETKYDKDKVEVYRILGIDETFDYIQ